METNQNNNAEMNTDISLKTKEQEIRSGQQRLRKKSTLLLTGAVVVIVVLFALGIAWYTRISNTYSIKFDVAEYDLAINNNTDDYYVLNMYDYSSVVNQNMAPGTIGWMPMDISIEYSQVDVEYAISLANMMPDEIAKHFRFFYLEDWNEDDEEWEIHYGGALEYTERTEDVPATTDVLEDYGTGTEDGATKRRVYLDPTSSTNKRSQDIKDTLKVKEPNGKHKTFCIYWEWYLDVETACADYTNTPGALNGSRFNVEYITSDGTTETKNSALWSSLSDDNKTLASNYWNELDTDIGRYPDKYADSLTVFIYTSGAQIAPDSGVKNVQETGKAATDDDDASGGTTGGSTGGSTGGDAGGTTGGDGN